MTNQDSRSRPVRVAFIHSSTLTKVVVLIALVLSMAALWTMTVLTRQARERADALREEAAALEQANKRLEQNIGELGSVQSVENIAREELGLVDPDTVVFGSD